MLTNVSTRSILSKNMAVTISEGKQIIIDAVSAVGTETVELSQSFGRILAEDVKAKEDVPAFNRSPYDGYAFRSFDVETASKEAPVTLKVVDYIPAGSVPQREIHSGEAVRIMTGAMVPEGADAIQKQEDTEFTEEEVKIFQSAEPGEHIIYAGSDRKKGTTLARAGEKIGPELMGILAGQNITEPLVYERLTVGILVTGSELVPIGEEPGPGKILATNQYVLMGLMEQEGFLCRNYGIVKDDLEEIKKALRKALEECDAILITGGASVGDYDLTPKAMEEIGAEIIVRDVQMKPGKACAYGVKDGKLICGLSGKPSSALNNLKLLGIYGLNKLSGRK